MDRPAPQHGRDRRGRRRVIVRRCALLAFAFMLTLAGCDMIGAITWEVTHGVDGLHARVTDFSAGTSRHPESYDEVFAGLVSCAEHYSGKMILTNVDLTVRGGFYLTSERYSRYVFAPDGSFQPRIEFGGLMWKDRGYVEHEFAHALSHDFPFLRNPLDTADTQGVLDHHGPFFAACVKYNPELVGE